DGVGVVDGALVVGAEDVVAVLARGGTVGAPTAVEGGGGKGRAAAPTVQDLATGVDSAHDMPDDGRDVGVGVLRVHDEIVGGRVEHRRALIGAVALREVLVVVAQEGAQIGAR